MKAWQVTQFGDPSRMTFTDIPTPEPGEGEVLIRNRAAGLNFFDLLLIQGKYQWKPELPFTPGREAAGTVAAAGPGVTDLSTGDRVMADVGSGSYAEYSIAKRESVLPIPGGMGFPEAAGFLIVYQTSYLALQRRGSLKPGEWLLVHAGASGVGMAALQIGKALGAKIIATAGSEDKLAFCQNQGADHILSYEDSDWVDRVKEITGGRGADVIFDPVGSDVFDLSTKCIAPEGRLLVVGFAGGKIPSIAANRILLKNISIVGVYYGRHVKEHPAFFSEAQEALNQLYREGKIHPRVSQKYPLEDARRALQDIARRRIIGKAVLLMGE